MPKDNQYSRHSGGDARNHPRRPIPASGRGSLSSNGDFETRPSRLEHLQPAGLARRVIDADATNALPAMHRGVTPRPSVPVDKGMDRRMAQENVPAKDPIRVVSPDRDLALKETQNWASYDHRTLYESVHVDNDPG
jgi:hypothetical protein